MKNMFLRVKRSMVLAGLALLLTACQQDLYSGLVEGEANLMLATLLENGIDAEKAARGKNGFSIGVPKADVVRALKILESRSLPREGFKNMGEVFSGQGMIASPTEEQARLAFALSQELAATFAQIDGVLTSRTHVVFAHHDSASGATTPASVAVFLRHVPDSPVADLQGKIKETCVQAVPGLGYDKVSVMLVPVRQEVVLPTESRGNDTGNSLLYGVLGVAVVLLIGSGIVFFYPLLKRKRRADEQEDASAADSTTP
jgi:type III secretion protein J